ncbi:MAG: hypothetical protein ACRYGK_18170 [Janthinobacterium lividum]
MKNFRNLILATSILAASGAVLAQTPMTPPSVQAPKTMNGNANPAGAVQGEGAPKVSKMPMESTSSDPLVQKRMSDADSKAQYKAEQKAAKAKMKADKKMAKAELKSEKQEASATRNAAMGARNPSPSAGGGQ